MKHSALRRAIEQGNLNAVYVALDHGADIEEADIHGDAGLPLRIACFRGRIDIVQALINRGANIHVPNGEGRDGPLRSALRGKHMHIVDLLIQFGAEMPTNITIPKAAPGERRKRGDRRMRNQGPPVGLRDRRFARDRRVTSLEVLQLDDLQWERYFSQSQIEAMRKAEEAFPELDLHEAARILDRVRD
jgi:hypothetical protein